MFTKYRTYTDDELYNEVIRHVDYRASNGETMCVQLLEELKNRIPGWLHLLGPSQGTHPLQGERRVTPDTR